MIKYQGPIPHDFELTGTAVCTFSYGMSRELKNKALVVIADTRML